MDLKITEKLIIPSKEIQWRFSRSSGPGGQNVNKNESQVEIIFNIHKSKTLNSFQKNHLLKKLKTKIFNGCIFIKVQENRTQFKNRQLAKQKLILLLKSIIISEEKVRRVTKPTKSSQRKRVESKKKRGKIKSNRQNKFSEDK
tara:strand:+ start:645 stop:1073 length:429 start_codon:yes stop_codon:yes gene_type:complete